MSSVTVDGNPRREAAEQAPSAPSKAVARRQMLSGLMLPALFVMAWAFALSGSKAPSAVAGEPTEVTYLKWILYFVGFAFVASSIMHSVFRKAVAASIGWVSNGFQLEIAFASLGLGIGCFYAIDKGVETMATISFPIVTFLFLAGVNHLIEIVRQKNYAPNNTMILVWDFGVPISLVALLVAHGTF
jgi:hypothetical protein